jgi:hypothetical protein
LLLLPPLLPPLLLLLLVVVLVLRSLPGVVRARCRAACETLLWAG